MAILDSQTQLCCPRHFTGGKWAGHCGGGSVFMRSVYDPKKGPAPKPREISLGGRAAGMGFRGALEEKATKCLQGPEPLNKIVWDVQSSSHSYLMKKYT